uniref:General transcription and DNA repair factor IIH subunit TFB5 n=1 Tax=Capra hircus TaxID=9925 RepID=A0A8C2P2U8_CAPHI
MRTLLSVPRRCGICGWKGSSAPSDWEKMVNVLKGVLIECDPAMKQFLLYLDESNALGKKFIIQDIDDTHVFVIAELVNVLQERPALLVKKMWKRTMKHYPKIQFLKAPRIRNNQMEKVCAALQLSSFLIQTSSHFLIKASALLLRSQFYLGLIPCDNPCLNLPQKER